MPDTHERPETEFPAQERNRRAWIVAAGATAPMLLHLLAKVFVWPRPHWAYHFDPEVIFLFSAIDVVEGRGPTHVEHPGMPLHAIGALIVRIVGTDPLGMDALRTVSYCVAFGLTVAATWLLARTVLRNLPLPLALAALWTYWLCPQTLFRTTVWSPETLFFATGGTALALCSVALRAGARMRSVVVAGLGLGVCVSLKYTFAPWVAAMAVALLVASPDGVRRGAARAAVACVAALAGFVAAVSPALDQPQNLLGLTWNVATRRGMYGSGGAGPPTLDEATTSVLGAIGSAMTWHTWVAGCAAACAVAWYRRRGRAVGADPELRGLLVFAVTSFVLTYAFVLRTGNNRYAMPTGLSVCAAVAASWSGAVTPAAGRGLRAVAAAFAAACGLLLARALLHDVFDDHRVWTTESARRRDAILALAREHVGSERPPVVVWSRRSPDPAFSLGMYSTSDAQVRRVHDSGSASRG